MGSKMVRQNFSMSDTTASVFAASGFIAGSEGSSMMYARLPSMPLGEGTGKEEVLMVYSFPYGGGLRKKMRATVNYKFSKRAKKMYDEYVQRNRYLHLSILKCSLDNATPINGTQRFIE